jgi:DNA-binding CsgD family transcriptional regulator
MLNPTLQIRSTSAAHVCWDENQYPGPERRTAANPIARWLSQTLDEIDYGMLVLDGDCRLLHANRAARAELDDSHPVRLLGCELRARHAADEAPLREALSAAARRGLRRLLNLGQQSVRASLAVVPLWPATGGDPGATLVMLGKRQMCERLLVQCFARAHGLTGAEARVLEALCRGLPPREIADEFGVGIATVRSQIGAIRQKTGAESIRSLLDMVAKLPPMASLIRPTLSAVTMNGWRPLDQPLPT